VRGQFTFEDDDSIVCFPSEDEFKYRFASWLFYHLHRKHALIWINFLNVD